VDTSSEDLNDKELADLMADPEMEDDMDDGVDGVVECGIPPEIPNDPVVDSSEQAFSADDFDSSQFEDSQDSQGDGSDGAGVTKESQPAVQDSSPKVLDNTPSPSNASPSNGHEEGDVAQFRKSLAGLSRQLELDRLTLLHETLSGNGQNLPTLGQIADDISGKKPLTPAGDCDEYDQRSSARLDGWVSGLSFGTNRRAKKFPK
jgi:hypothetical protein